MISFQNRFCLKDLHGRTKYCPHFRNLKKSIDDHVLLLAQNNIAKILTNSSGAQIINSHAHSKYCISFSNICKAPKIHEATAGMRAAEISNRFYEVRRSLTCFLECSAMLISGISDEISLNKLALVHMIQETCTSAKLR